MPDFSSHKSLKGCRLALFGVEGTVSLPEGVDATAFLGGKGANLVRMNALGLPVPPGFTLPTPWCALFEKDQDAVLDEALALVMVAYARLADEFGYYPLVSVRSGAPVSMPGMMDTILNVGLTKGNLQDWAERIGLRAALDSRRRLIQMLGATAYGVPSEQFEAALTNAKTNAGVSEDKELSELQLQVLIAEYQTIFAKHVGHPFPEVVSEQLRAAIRAVFASWRNERADVYRKMHGIPVEMGTAVTVQAMVFGNFDDESGSGVLFTRNPSNGQPGIFGEFLPNAQGEDVVAGVRTPLPYAELQKLWPAMAQQIESCCHRLEEVYQDMMDVEFTIQQQKLYLLQCRVGKRSSLAKFQIAHDMCVEGRIGWAEAVSRVTAKDFIEISRPSVDPSFPTPANFTGLPGSPGVVSGIAIEDSADAVKRAAAGETIMLVRHETDPDDIAAMAASVGVLTKTGGSTSHAAVVARAMNKPCVVGCETLNPSKVVGHKVTICGETGRVWLGVDVPVLGGALPEAAMRLLERGSELQGLMPVVTDVTKRIPTVPFILSTLDHYGDSDWWMLQLKALKAAKDSLPEGSFVQVDQPIVVLDDPDKAVVNMAWGAGDAMMLWPQAKFGDSPIPVTSSNQAWRETLWSARPKLKTAQAQTVEDLMKPATVQMSSALENLIGGSAAVRKLVAWCSAEFGVRVVRPGPPIGAVLFRQQVPAHEARPA